MNAKEIMLALLEGKKVGANLHRYMYLNIDGEIVVNCEEPEGFADSEILGSLFMWEAVTIQPEEKG